MGPLPKKTALPQMLPQVVIVHVYTELSLKVWGCCGFVPCNQCHLSLRGDVLGECESVTAMLVLFLLTSSGKILKNYSVFVLKFSSFLMAGCREVF